MMDMRYEAAPMVAEATVVKAILRITRNFIRKVTALSQVWVASFSCLSMGGTSLNAVSPDSYFTDRRLAVG